MTLSSKVERRGARERNVGGPTRPTPPGKNIGGRRKSGQPRGYAATPPLSLPQYPSPDASLLSALAGIPDPRDKATKASSYIMNAVACGAPHSHIEKKVGLPPGNLVALLLRDRELLLQYCVTLVEAANFEDAEARRILATVARQPTTAANTRTILNYTNSLRTAAEGRRRLSESLVRKAALPVREHDARADRAFKKVWDKLMGAPNAFAPATSVEILTTSSDPLVAAQEILPQLRGDLDARRAAGEPGIQLVGLADQVRRVEQFIKRHTAAPQPAAQQQTTSPIAPAWIAPQPKTTKPAPTHRTLDEQYQKKAEHHRSQHEPGTVQYLKAMLAWAEAALPKDDPLVKRQLASLRGRVRASDLDAAAGEEKTPEEAESPSSPVTQPDQAATDIICLGNLRFNLKADPSSRSPSPPPQPARPTSNAELESLRAATKKARREAYGFPDSARPVLRAEQLEAELAEMEAKMQSP